MWQRRGVRDGVVCDMLGMPARVLQGGGEHGPVRGMPGKHLPRDKRSDRAGKLLLSSTHVPTMLLVPSVQLKEASAFLRAHSPSPSHTAPLGHVWHESDSDEVSGSVMMR